MSGVRISDSSLSSHEVYEIPLQKVVANPDQPRKNFDPSKLDELARSIKQHGLLQPIMVKPNGDDTYEIIHGERRFRAHRLAALPTIKCILSDMSDAEIADARLVENVARDDLTPLELAHEFQKRVDKEQTHQEIADSINKSRAYVSQRLALLNLSDEQKKDLENGKLSFAEARTLTRKTDTGEERQEYSNVRIHDLEVPKILEDYGYGVTNLEELYKAYRKDLSTIRRSLHLGGLQQ